MEIESYYPSTYSISIADEKYLEISERIAEIAQQLEIFRNLDSQTITLDIEPNPKGTYVIPQERLQRIAEGCCGSYYLLDILGNKQFIIKPNDEESGCLNNPKGWEGVTTSSIIRTNMPLYCSALKEAATYEVALSVGLTSIAPKTALKICESEQFFIGHNWEGSKEKLCSIQEFVPNATTLDSLFRAMFAPEEIPISKSDAILALENLPFHEEKDKALQWLKNQVDIFPETTICPNQKEEIIEAIQIIPKLIELLKENQVAIKELERIYTILNVKIGQFVLPISQNQYEDLLILIWLSYDTDANIVNVLTYPMGDKIGLKKIDNGLSFPIKNTSLCNPSILFLNSLEPLSTAGKEKILAMNENTLTQILRSYGLDDAIPAFSERIQLLKTLALTPNITLKEMDEAMKEIKE